MKCKTDVMIQIINSMEELEYFNYLVDNRNNIYVYIRTDASKFIGMPMQPLSTASLQHIMECYKPWG